MSEIEFDFQTAKYQRKLSELERDIFDHIMPGAASAVPPSPSDPLDTIRDQIDAAATRAAQYPRRIRVTEIVPPGMMLLAPFEEDGSVPGPHRRVNDGGPVEVLAHPDDWEAIVKTFRGDVPPIGGCQIYGIPVKDDTIKTRTRAR